MSVNQLNGACRRHHRVSLEDRLVGYVLAADITTPIADETLLKLLEAKFPAVEETDVSGVYVDLRGMERLYGPPRAVGTHLLSALRKTFGSHRLFKVGIAPGKFTANMAAKRSDGKKPYVVMPAEASTFLASLPIGDLPVDDDVKRKLSFLGFHHLGQVSSLSHEAMVAQFGREGLLIAELASGVDDIVVRPRRLFRPIGATLHFPVPIVDWHAFWAGVRQLLTQVWKRRERKDKTVRGIHLSANLTETTWEKKITLPEPIGDVERLRNLLRRRLQGETLPGEVTSLTLQIVKLGPAYAGQEKLFPERGARMRQIKEAFAGIKSRDGESGLYRIAEVERWSRIPERRYALVSFDL